MIFSFGPFQIDPQERRLLRHGEELHLQPKTLDTLILLVKRRGRLVSKEDLMNQIWPDQVVTEHSITRCIREVRKAIGDSPAKSKYIETVPKAGYRFVAQVEQSDRPTEASKPLRIPPSKRSGWLFAGLLAAALVITFVTIQWKKSSAPDETRVIPVLAILPFSDMTRGEDNDLVLAGLVQDIRERLSSSGRVAVTSGISAAALASVSQEQNSWPQALNADWLLEGTLEEDEKRQSVMLSLSTATGAPGWQDRIHIVSGDLIGLSDKIAVQVAAVLGFELPAQARFLSRAASVESINAHHQYLLARGLIAQRTPKNMARAITVLHDVLELMPNHANAMSALGIAYMLSPDSLYPAKVAMERAEGLFDSALEIDPDTALAWAGRALSEAHKETDHALQKEYINRALQLNPYDADVLGWAANVAGSEGRIDDAFDYFQQALVIDPLHTSVNGNLSFNLASQGRYDQAWMLLNNLTEQLGNHPALYYFKVSIATNTGDLKTALELAHEAVEGWPEGLFFAGQLAHVYAHLQMQSEAYYWNEYAQTLGTGNQPVIGTNLEVAILFNDQDAIRKSLAELLTHNDFEDDNPPGSAPWLLTKLTVGNGYLNDCTSLERYLSYQFDSPESLQGRRGTFVYMAHLAHWKAWCLLQSGKQSEAETWLDAVSNQFEFMKTRGLGDSTPHMYVEAQNHVMRQEPTAALNLLYAMVDIGWLNQGALQHDPRWDGIRETPEFENLLRDMALTTRQLQIEVQQKGGYKEVGSN